MGELVLQGRSQDSWATLWQISGNRGAAWHKVDVNIPALASQLRFVANTSLGDIALDTFESLGFPSNTAVFGFQRGHVRRHLMFFSDVEH